MRRKLGIAARMIHDDPLNFFRFFGGKVIRRLVYSALTSEIASPEIIDGIEFRKLSDAELGTLPPNEELRREQLKRLQRMGFNGAYGVFYQGHLAHISWLVTSNQKLSRHLKLAKDEAEITGCVTVANMRGHGIYPFAIRSIAQRATSCGIRRIFMKTRPFNTASQRGMEKAGLRLQGQTLHFYLPYLPQITGLIFRRFRRH